MKPFTKSNSRSAIAKIALVVAFVAHMSDGRPSNRLWEEIDDYLAPNPLAFEYTESAQDCSFTNVTKFSERIVPSHYDIVLEPNPGNLAAFEGAVRISVGVHNDYQGDQIVLHADQSLDIERIWYVDYGQPFGVDETSQLGRSHAQESNLVAVERVCRDRAKQLLVISLEKNLEPNSRGQLHLTFGSDSEHQAQVLFWGASSWEFDRARSAPARNAFPCFDEPALKATFSLSLIQPADHVALSNGHTVDEQLIEEAADESGIYNDDTAVRRKLVRFARTPRMSPHLLALALGNFELASERDLTPNYDQEQQQKVSVRIYTQKGRVASGQASLLTQFAIDAASQALTSMQDYFGIEYPLKKLDFLAVPAPGDRHAPAGGWGLVVASEKAILIDDWYVGPETQAQTLEIVLQELARQWLGNLVTVDAADGAYDAWLSEGLISLMMYKFGQEFFPRFDFQYRYLIDSHLVALEEEAGTPFSYTMDDQNHFAHPLPSYKKAAAIVRVVQENLGEDKFKQAIRNYLKDHQFQTVKLDDLCRTFDGQLIASMSRGLQKSNSCDILRSFNNQSGCPLIEASINGGQSKLGLEQKRFSASKEVINGPGLEESWPHFPIVLESSNCSGNEEFALVQDTIQGERLAFELPECMSTATNLGGSDNSLNRHQYWLKLNANFTGFYRVLYDDSLFELMRKPIEQRTLSPADRLNLLDETRALALANRVPAMRLLNLIIWSHNEDNGAVLVALVEAYRSLMDIVKEDSNLGAKLTLFGHQLFGRTYNTKLRGGAGASESEQNHMEMRARAAVLNLLVDENYQPAMNESIELFIETDTMVPFHLREPVYAAVTKGACDAHQGWLFAKLEATASREERARLTVSLARAVQPGRLLMIWRWLKQKNLAIDADQKLRAFENLLASEQGLEFVLQMAKDKGSKEIATVEASKPMVSLVLKQLILTGKISDPQEAARAYPELFDGAAQRGLAADWPEEAEELIELRARRVHALQGSYQELEAAFSTL